MLFKKHKVTILLSLQPHEPLSSAKEKLIAALKSRNVEDINGDKVPEDAESIELGVPVDRAEPEKGWISLESSVAEEDEPSKSDAKSNKSNNTVLSAGLSNGHSVAFRFRKPGDESEPDRVDPGWDVVLPSFENEEEEDI